MSEDIQIAPKESNVDSPYPFLQNLSKDHPQLSSTIANKLPQWKMDMTKRFGNPAIAESLLQGMDYVSEEEMQTTLNSWAEEVTDILKNTDKKIFILKGVGGSQAHFGDEVYNKIPQELRDKVTILEGNAQIDKLASMTKNLDEFRHTDYYLFDDSINSGEQVAGQILPKFAQMPQTLQDAATLESRSLDYDEFVKRPQEEKPVFHIRTMRMTNYAEDRVKQKWERLQRSTSAGKERPVLSLDIKATKSMPTIDEVLSQHSITNEPELSELFIQQHVTGPGILGMFATKIQDNLPSVMVKSKFTPPEITPLFEQSDIKTPWKSLTNK